MKTIPIFKGVTNEQHKKLLYICYQKTLSKDFFIYEQGDESNELFILIKGQLKVLFHKNTLLTHISPIGLVGEIGVFTGKPRLTSVITTIESTIIKIHKTELFNLFKSDYVLSNRILLNVINELAQKLQKYTEIIEDVRNMNRNVIL